MFDSQPHQILVHIGRDIWIGRFKTLAASGGKAFEQPI